MSEHSKRALIEYLKSNYVPGQDWSAIAKKFDIPKEIARNTWLRYRKRHKLHVNTNSPASPSETKVTEFAEDLKSGKAEVVVSSPVEIRNLKDLEKIIDTSRWEVMKYIQNYWGNASNPHWQVKAWLEPKKLKANEVLESFLKGYKTTWKPIPEDQLQINAAWEEPSMLLINLNDLHFDKLDLDNNTIDRRIEDYRKVLGSLVLRSYRSSNIEKIVFVIGNDMFNTDNFQNATTNGTPQQINTSWDKAYEKVFEAMVDSISFLKGFCKELKVVLVPGNHDRTKSFYLTHALEMFFLNDKAIVFDRDSSLKKRVVFGQQFIGLNHGNNVNDKLPLAFATEFYEDWGKCKYHDIVISDKHHNNEKTFRSKQTQNEFQGVKLRILPSLSGTDTWHSDNLYRSRQSGIALIYDKKRGKSAEFEYQM